MAVALMREGKRVGVTSLSHKAIHKFLREIEREADEQGFTFSGAKRGDPESETAFEGRCVVTVDRHGRLRRPGVPARRGHGVGSSRGRASTSMRPSGRSTRSSSTRRARWRSPTCSRSARPRGTSSCSATRTSCRRSRRARTRRAREARCSQHLLGEHETVPPERGIFLAETWRLRPELCAFTSDAYYEGRLDHAPVTARRTSRARRRARAGSRSSTRDTASRPTRRRARSPRRSTGCSGRRSPTSTAMTRPLEPERRPRRRAVQRAGADAARRGCPTAVAVGTVDKFQGQQAPVVFVSMASSTSEEAPRGIGFAFDPPPVQRRDVACAVPRRARLRAARCSTPTARRSRRCGSSTPSAGSSSWPRTAGSTVRRRKARASEG